MLAVFKSHTIWRNPQIQILALLAALLSLFVGSLLSGAGQISVADSWAYLFGQPSADSAQLAMVMQHLRLPRTVAAVLVGASLGVAGVLLQSATRNPLAESGLLGVNAGAALSIVIGAALAQVHSSWDYLLWAFAGALIANALVLLLAQSGSPLRLVLAGVALGATFQGITSYILLSNAAAYEQYRFWILGSLSGSSREMIWPLIPVAVLSLLAALFLARPLSALLLGDESAQALGYRPGQIRIGVALISTLLSGLAVALAGPLAFLGLIAPYLARLLTGPRLNQQIIFSALLGAIVLLIADIIARLLSQPFDSPVGIILALMGAPVLIGLVRSNRLVTAI